MSDSGLNVSTSLYTAVNHDLDAVCGASGIASH